jgi:hypothetical protein
VRGPDRKVGNSYVDSALSIDASLPVGVLLRKFHTCCGVAPSRNAASRCLPDGPVLSGGFLTESWTGGVSRVRGSASWTPTAVGAPYVTIAGALSPDIEAICQTPQ